MDPYRRHFRTSQATIEHRDFINGPRPGRTRSGSAKDQGGVTGGAPSCKCASPDFFAIHPVEAEAPEEDVLLLDVSFLSTTAEATMHVPSYAAWLEETDQSPAYAYMVKLLKLLQWQRPAKRWVLKTSKSSISLKSLPMISI